MSFDIRLRLYIFSYNRSVYLEGLISSLERNGWPKRLITIIDDCSDDKRTKDILRKLGDYYEVMNSKAASEKSRNGGLHEMMNLALSHAEASKVAYAVFVQDDMQAIRPFDPNYLDSCLGDLKRNNLLTCSVVVEKQRRQELRKKLSIDLVGHSLYRRNNLRIGHRYYQDTGIFDVSIRKRLGIVALTGESEMNELLAKSELPLTCLRRPLFAFIPFPVSFSGREHLLGDRIAQVFLPPKVQEISVRDNFQIPACFDDLILRDLKGRPLEIKIRPAYSGGASRYLKRQDGSLKTLGKFLIWTNHFELQLRALLKKFINIFSVYI
jgi:glycosyltransferase involved in cell wall biosynthesis